MDVRNDRYPHLGPFVEEIRPGRNIPISGRFRFPRIEKPLERRRS